MNQSLGLTGSRAKFPVIPGHEAIGRIVAVGPGESRWKVGDRAGGAWHGGQDNQVNDSTTGEPVFGRN